MNNVIRLPENPQARDRYVAKDGKVFDRKAGKSLTAEGGQNPIEPGALGKPMVFGPNMQNFEAIAQAFLARHGAIQVKDKHELETALGELLSDPKRALELGLNASGVVRENLGAIERTLDMIVSHLQDSEIYIAPKRALPGRPGL